MVWDKELTKRENQISFLFRVDVARKRKHIKFPLYINEILRASSINISFTSLAVSNLVFTPKTISIKSKRQKDLLEQGCLKEKGISKQLYILEREFIENMVYKFE